MRNDTCSEYLRYDYLAGEIQEMGKDLARAYNRMNAIEEEESAMKADIKERKARVEQEVGALSRKITQQFEMRNVDCAIYWHNPTPGFCTIVRKDTGEVVKERIMTMEERQELLPFPDRQTREIPKAELVRGLLAEVGEEHPLDLVAKWSDTDLILALEWAKALKAYMKASEKADPSNPVDMPVVPDRPVILLDEIPNDVLTARLYEIGIAAPEVTPEGFRWPSDWNHHERHDVMAWAQAIYTNEHLAEGQEAVKVPARPDVLSLWKRPEPPPATNEASA